MSSTRTGREIELQVMWNRLEAVVEEQAQALIRTAFSPIVRECGDISAGIFDVQGRMLAQAVTGTPGHVNTMAEGARHFLAAFPAETMRPGDIYCTNDPWLATGHLNDLLLLGPIFHRGVLVGLVSCTSHLYDLGGLGMGPDGSDVYDEGLFIPMARLVDQGTINHLLLDMIKANSRAPISNEGDVYALISCCEVGAARLGEMMERVRARTTGRALRVHLPDIPRCNSRIDRSASRRRLHQFDGGRRLRVGGRSASGADDRRKGDGRRLHRHLAVFAQGRQRPDQLHGGIHDLRSAVHRRAGYPQQRRLAGTFSRVSSSGDDSVGSTAGPGGDAPHHRPPDQRSGDRLPRPGAARSGSRRKLFGDVGYPPSQRFAGTPR